MVVLWWFITIGRLVTISASAVWYAAIGTTIRSWTMDSLYLRIYAMLVFEIFIFAILQVPINFDGEPISFVIVLKGGVLVYFLQMRIDVTAVKWRRWSRSSRFFFLFLLSLSFVAVQVQSGKEIFHGISGSGSHRRIRTSITPLLVASVTWGRITSIGGSLVTSSVRLRLSLVSGPITSFIWNLESLSVPTVVFRWGWG